jgi:hypothetical protein
MLAFGVKENYDQTGQFLDARNALWSMMSNPSATFSPDAIKALNTALAQDTGSTVGDQAAQVLATHPVPEPATVALWVVGSMAFLLHRRARSAG